MLLQQDLQRADGTKSKPLLRRQTDTCKSIKSQIWQHKSPLTVPAININININMPIAWWEMKALMAVLACLWSVDLISAATVRAINAVYVTENTQENILILL